MLIENGANLEDKEEHGWTSIYIAAQNGHVEVVKVLIKKGANVLAKDSFGKTSICVTTKEGKFHRLIRRTDLLCIFSIVEFSVE